MRSIHRARAMCEWEDFAGAAPRVRAMMAAPEGGLVPPFLLLSEPGITAGEQRACSELWTAERRAAAAIVRRGLDLRVDLRRREKITVGYLSSDFHDHATAHLLIETLEAHDRTRFDIRGYSYGCADEGSMRRRLTAAFDGFCDISASSDAEAARRIHADGVDMLVDLKGFTSGARTGVAMLRPAPVQVNYLGYPGTMGEGVCDYIITDRFVTPLAAAPDYAEAFAYMPQCYQPRGRAPLGPAPTRTDAGLPEKGFVFCCFNQAYKFTPFVFDLWARLLDDAPGSVLWLLRADVAEGNLRNEMRRRGIDAARLIFAAHLGQSDHLTRLRLADLVLDTSPFGAHTTASDALWSGAPIVTCPGETFASRVAGSILGAVGLPELIARDFDDYFVIARTLAGDPLLLARLKSKLAENRLTAALFDVGAYTRGIEALYAEMWRRKLSGARPAMIEIA
jgi:predicted O-linked N-acetylglucosamine transferase (SPINDLY family)